MKKYIKPSIETIEANLSADYLQGASNVYNEPTTGPQLAPDKKGSYDDWEGDDENYGW